MAVAYGGPMVVGGNHAGGARLAGVFDRSGKQSGHAPGTRLRCVDPSLDVCNRRDDWEWTTIVHILPALVAGLGLLCSGRSGWRNEVLAALLFLFTLVKPSISAPFFWIVLFSAGTLRPAALVALGYAGLTLIAASFQRSSILTLLQSWLANPALGQSGEMNLRAWLVDLGLGRWSLPASALALTALGFWTYRHRRADLWLLMGVAALVSRMWTYHRWYDDLLILLPMMALFRITKAGSSDHSDIVAGGLLGVATLAMLAPGGLYLFPQPWNTLYTSGQIIVWIMLLIFLLDQARRTRSN